MPTLIIETTINAAPKICFDLVRRASTETNIQKIIGGFEKAQIVTFYGSFLGFKQDLTLKVTDFERPQIFIDAMTEGNFKSFRHIHEFTLQNDSQTLLKDTFEWSSPFGIFGKIIDKVFLKKRLREIVVRRNQRLKQITEREKGAVN